MFRKTTYYLTRKTLIYAINIPTNLAQLHTVKKLNTLLPAAPGSQEGNLNHLHQVSRNTQLRQVIISLAVENNQYATELSLLLIVLAEKQKRLNQKMQRKQNPRL